MRKVYIAAAIFVSTVAFASQSNAQNKPRKKTKPAAVVAPTPPQKSVSRRKFDHIGNATATPPSAPAQTPANQAEPQPPAFSGTMMDGSNIKTKKPPVAPSTNAPTPPAKAGDQDTQFAGTMMEGSNIRTAKPRKKGKAVPKSTVRRPKP